MSNSPCRSVKKLMAVFDKLWPLIENEECSVVKERHAGFRYEELSGKLIQIDQRCANCTPLASFSFRLILPIQIDQRCANCTPLATFLFRLILPIQINQRCANCTPLGCPHTTLDCSFLTIFKAKGPIFCAFGALKGHFVDPNRIVQNVI